MYEKYGKVEKNVSLKKFNTYQVGGETEYLVYPSNLENLKRLIKKLEKDKTKYYVIGNGSNIIFPDENLKGVIVNLKELNTIEIREEYVKAFAGVMMPRLNKYLLDLGYGNFIWACNLPGTLGASIYGNAGCFKKEAQDNLISVDVMDKFGEIKTLKKEQIKFSYRSSDIKGIVVSAIYKLYKVNDLEKDQIKNLNEKRMQTQPLDKKTAGSVFKNPEGDSAGRLIEQAGLKGYQIGGAKISEKHANFICNENNATSKDIIDLIEYTKDVVKQKFNVDLKLEQKIVKWD